mmetsp:Transcript_248/g.239  ORF Transcript_248/g.239 Transcript_248/m.239 type:complete len:109 (-) Transcript_248:65-391(-)
MLPTVFRRFGAQRAFCGSVNSVRSFVKVGDKVPVNYLKDEKPPVILEDKEYPDWLKTIADKSPTKKELLEKREREGVEAMTVKELKRLKRLISLEDIKSANKAKASEV